MYKYNNSNNNNEMKSTKVLTLSSLCKHNYCNFLNSDFFTTFVTTQHHEYIHEQVLIICIHFHSDTALYPDSGFQLIVVYPKVVPVVFIPTLVYILTVVSSLSDCSPHHSPHSYFHVIFISAYPAVRVKICAYVNMLG